MRDFLDRIRWWWWVGILWIAGYVFAASMFGGTGLRRWVFGGPTSMRLLGALTPFLLGVAWLVVVAPIFDARARSFSDRRPAARRASLHRVLALVPMVVFGFLLLQFGLVHALGIDHSGWLTPGYGAVLAGAFALSIYYARLSRRNLDQSLRAAAARAGVCYACNYPLAGADGDRCPECGAELADVINPSASGED